MTSHERRRILVVGGVAGGASCAARARRLCERCEIVIFDRGPYVSFANCGLPYHVGGVIADEANLLVATPELFKERFEIDVRTETEVLAIDRGAKAIEVRELATGAVRREPYDALVLATGARALRPPLPGIDLPGIFVVRTIPDTRKIRDAVEGAGSAVVVGGGFIGLEMAENLSRRGLHVTVVELAEQVLPPLDPEMAAFVAAHLERNGVTLRLGSGVEAFRTRADGKLLVATSAGEELGADLVILAIGVRPDTSLAEAAGLALGERGGIRVDAHMRTSDPSIWAVGDVVEVRDVVTGGWQLVPLAGPAQRQGRIAAAAILGRAGDGAASGARAAHITSATPGTSPVPGTNAGRGGGPGFRGVQGTAICGVFGLAVATTGASERTLRRAGRPYRAIYLHPGSHVAYFPGATPIHLKLLFDPESGRVLGAQGVGEAGVARRIDVIAMAIQMGATVLDLEEAELCYAPQFGAAKDPVNLAGMIAANHLRGDLPLADWGALGATPARIVDVRRPVEFARGHLPGAINMPLEKLRRRLGELPSEGEIWLVCGVGQRAYYATRLLAQRGLAVRNLSGGMATYDGMRAARVVGGPA